MLLADDFMRQGAGKTDCRRGSESGQLNESHVCISSADSVRSRRTSGLQPVSPDMGYGSDRFLTPPAINFICSVCREVFRNPKELPCGHMLRAECLMNIQQADGMFQCPPDRKISFTFDEPNQFFKEQCSELRVNCQWQRFGCDEKKMIGQEEQHEQHRPLILQDGEDHSCIRFLQDEVREQGRLLVRLQQKMERRMREDELDKEDLRNKVALVEQQRDEFISRYLDEKRAKERGRGSGDA